MAEHKRSPISIDQGTLTSLASKRHKADLSISTKERKEKVGERIAALQQLVSPFGKTDTASVLLEAMDYIRFLQEQVKQRCLESVDPHPTVDCDCILNIHVLSAPYLQSTTTAKMQELEPYSLRSRGLCLVPISYTVGVDRSNGADIWAPIKTTSSPKF